ncbi:MAG: aldehyde dehydrogenase family protein [Thaumarchaeota archaeon]|nr:aldehyde dehydrogenase family protein [Nitrososphaerota archaeon]
MKLLVGGEWKRSDSQEWHDFFDPAVGAALGRVPFSSKEEVNLAIESAQGAFESWRSLPIGDRVKYLFRLKEVMEANSEELAELNTRNHGKTLEESRGDIRRALENVDVAISVAYTLSKGANLDQIARGIDEKMAKEPLGVFAIICPFNFPLMIPFWFLPYAVVLGNTVVVKPSEITPLPMQRVASLIKEEVGLPPGVFNLVHGGSKVVETLIANSATKGVTNGLLPLWRNEGLLLRSSAPSSRHSRLLHRQEGNDITLVEPSTNCQLLVGPPKIVRFMKQSP